MTAAGKTRLVEPTAARITEGIRAALRRGDGEAARRVFDRVRAADPALARRVAHGLAGGGS